MESEVQKQTEVETKPRVQTRSGSKISLIKPLELKKRSSKSSRKSIGKKSTAMDIEGQNLIADGKESQR